MMNTTQHLPTDSGRPRHQNGKRSVLRLLSILTMSITMVSVVTAFSPRADAATLCANPWLLPTGSGPTVHTLAGFSQRTLVFDCHDVSLPKVHHAARVHASPDPGFAGSHVQACTLHVQLWDSANGYWGDETADCTAQARAGRPFEVWTQGWITSTTNSPRHWWVSGFVNIRTGVYHGTQGYRSGKDVVW